MFKVPPGNVMSIRPWLKPSSWAATAIDSTIEGNRLYDANGITAHGHYRTEDSPAVGFIGTSAFLVYASEIRNNFVEGEYDFPDSRGAINLHYGTVNDMPSPVVAYNVAVSHNTVIRADAGRIADPPHAGISVYKTWLRSELTPYNWKAPLIFHNHFEDIDNGIIIEDSWTHSTVLYGNTFTNVGTPLIDNGTNTAVLP